MSDYYILTAHEKKNAVTVAFHIPIPATNNIVGTPWRTAVAQSRETVSAVPWMDSTEQTALDNGDVLEIVRTVEYSANLTDAQKLAAVKAHYTEYAAALLATLQDKLQYWGKEGDVP